MLEFHGQRYVPIGVIEKYTGVNAEEVFQFVREHRVKVFRVNGHLMVCLEDVKKNMEDRICNLTK